MGFSVSFDFSLLLICLSVLNFILYNSVYIWILLGALHAVAEDVRYLALQVLKDDDEDFEDSAQI